MHEKSPPPEELNQVADLLERLARDLRDAAMSNVDLKPKNPIYLEGWSMTSRDAPALMGHVSGHPTLGTTFLRTSELYYIDTQSGWARTLSRWYRLGAPAVTWRTL